MDNKHYKTTEVANKPLIVTFLTVVLIVFYALAFVMVGFMAYGRLRGVTRPLVYKNIWRMILALFGIGTAVVLCAFAWLIFVTRSSIHINNPLAVATVVSIFGIFIASYLLLMVAVIKLSKLTKVVQESPEKQRANRLIVVGSYLSAAAVLIGFVGLTAASYTRGLEQASVNFIPV